MPPAVSVCLPVFNGECFLLEAVESVLNQTERDFELILVDDASSDGSWELIRTIADPRIKAFRNATNQGLFENYNICLSKAKGEFIKLAAQDDLLEPEAIAKSIAVLRANPRVSLVCADRKQVDETGLDISLQANMFAFSDFLPVNTPVSAAAAIPKALLPITNFIGEPAAVTFRRSHVGSGFDTSLYHLGDLEYWLRLLGEGDLYCIGEPLSKFRLHQSSSTATNARSLLFTLDFLKIGRKFSVLLQQCGSTEKEFQVRNIDSLAEHVNNLTETGEVSLSDLRAQGEFCSRLYERASGKNDAPSVRPDVMTDWMDFRELMLLSMRRTVELRRLLEEICDDECNPLLTLSINEVLGSSARQRSLRGVYLQIRSNAKRISKLEVKLTGLLSSRSWHTTKPLRDLKRSLAKSNLVRSFKHDRNCSESPVELTQLRGYERVGNDATPELIIEHQKHYMDYLRRQIELVESSQSWKVSAPLRLFNSGSLGPDGK